MFEITTPKVTQPEFQLFYFFTCLNSRHLVIRKEDITFLGNKWLSTGCCLAPGCPRSQAAQRHNHDEIRNDSPTNYFPRVSRHLKSCKDGEGMICLTFRNFWVGCKYFERDWCGAYLVQKAIRSLALPWSYSQKSSSFKNQKYHKPLKKKLAWARKNWAERSYMTSCRVAGRSDGSILISQLAHISTAF